MAIVPLPIIKKEEAFYPGINKPIELAIGYNPWGYVKMVAVPVYADLGNFRAKAEKEMVITIPEWNCETEECPVADEILQFVEEHGLKEHAMKLLYQKLEEAASYLKSP